MKQYFEANQKLWDNRVSDHMHSEFYGLDSWKSGRNSVPVIDRELLGDVAGKSLLHLQCHFGQDTLSLARMGAQVTGVDFSPEAIEQARKLAGELNLTADFVCCNVLEASDHIDQQFDIVYTSYGTIGWLPDLTIWAEQISRLLKPGGQFLIVDFHPMLWSLDFDSFAVAYSYFNTEVIAEEAQGSYTDDDRSGKEKHAEYGWNHPFADILTPLLQRGFSLRHFQEFDYSPWPCFSNVTETAPGKWKFASRKKEIPMVYALDFRKSE